jgi:hypothetical protein
MALNDQKKNSQAYIFESSNVKNHLLIDVGGGSGGRL